MNNFRQAPFKKIDGKVWARAEWNDVMKYGPDFDSMIDEELPQTAKACHEDWQDLLASPLPADVKAEWSQRLLAQKDLLRAIEKDNSMTQTKSLYAYLQNSTHGATPRELIAFAIKTWPTQAKTLKNSVYRLLYNACAECKGYQGKENLFAYREVNGRKVWFAR